MSDEFKLYGKLKEFFINNYLLIHTVQFLSALLISFREQPIYSNKLGFTDTLFNSTFQDNSCQSFNNGKWIYYPGNITQTAIHTKIPDEVDSTLPQFSVRLIREFIPVELETISSYFQLFDSIVNLRNIVYKNENHRIKDQRGNTVNNVKIPPNLSITDLSSKFNFTANLVLTGDDYFDSRKFWLKTFMEEANKCLYLMNEANDILNKNRIIDRSQKYSESTFIDDHIYILEDFIAEIKIALGEITNLPNKPDISEYSKRDCIVYSNGSIFFRTFNQLPEEHDNAKLNRLCKEQKYIDENNLITDPGVAHLSETALLNCVWTELI